MGRGILAEDVETIMIPWHEHFAPVFSTDLDEALNLLRACIDSTLKKILEGKFTASQTDHSKILKGWKLSGRQKEFLQDLEAGDLPSQEAHASTSTLPDLSCCHPLLVRDDRRDKKDLSGIKKVSKQDLRFVECLIVMCAYEMRKDSQDGSTVPMTNNQIRDLLRVRHDLDLDSQQLNRLRKKFITRDTPARIRELLVMVSEGTRGIPSRYRLTGLAEAFGG